MTTSKKILIALIVIVVAATVYSLITNSSPDTNPTDQVSSMQEKCAIEITSLILEDKDNQYETPEEITRAMFDHYFSFYKQIPECPTDALEDYSLTDVGEITIIPELPKAFTAEITFDLKPLSMEEAMWKSPEATVDGDWIRGKKGILSIRTTVATSSSATTTHFLSI